jgi:hypothetical protein
MVRVAVLFEKRAASGEGFLSGRIGNLRVMVLRNPDRHDDKRIPGFVLAIEPWPLDDSEPPDPIARLDEVRSR